MQLYVVVGVCQGELSHIRGFIDPGEAEMELERLKDTYGIVPEQEEESENVAELHEIDVDAGPTSVAVRRQIW